MWGRCRFPSPPFLLPSGSDAVPGGHDPEASFFPPFFSLASKTTTVRKAPSFSFPSCGVDRDRSGESCTVAYFFFFLLEAGAEARGWNPSAELTTPQRIGRFFFLGGARLSPSSSFPCSVPLPSQEEPFPSSIGEFLRFFFFPVGGSLFPPAYSSAPLWEVS